MKKNLYNKKYNIIAALLVVIAVFASLSYVLERSNQQPKSKEEVLSLANQLYESTDGTAAVIVMENYLKNNRDDKEIATKLASYYFMQKRYDDFLKIYQENNLESVSLMNMSAAAHQAKGDTDNAIRIYKEAIEKYPRNTQAYVSLSALYQSLSNKTEALAIIEKGLTVLPNSSQLLVTAASVAMKMGDNAVSAAYARRALEIDGDNEQASSILVAVGG
ncbi:MAG: Tetratricopeptide repeat protein [bacterium ADurb.Bin212]|nr:MAG: Tetratricopeptide repeat protein [bacterium ADurb.Bin212]